MAIHELNNNPTLAGQVRLIENVVYGAADGEAQQMSLLTPWAQRYQAAQLPARPLIVFVQGSSWRLPTLGEEIPQLVQFVHQGYVVATVQHRNSLDGHAFPAFLTDVKAAIRYLRAHATEYAIDPARVSVWGTSSGANAAMLVGLTGDDPKYKTAADADRLTQWWPASVLPMWWRPLNIAKPSPVAMSCSIPCLAPIGLSGTSSSGK